jgi:pyrroloquinoline quinone biosynthesis protein B
VDLAELVKTVDYALIDATFYADGELPGRDMSKIPHPFVVESMQLLENLSPGQRNKVWFIHLNHTNPLLDPDSDASKAVRLQGFNIATEGIRLNL